MPVKDWISNRFFIPRQNAYSLNSTSSFFSRLAFNLPLIYSHYAIILPKCFMKSTFFRYAKVRITKIMRTKQKCEPNSADMSL